jgi:hemoglobin-like flavoprotein
MTPEQILLVRSSWPPVAMNAEALTRSFYKHLFEIDHSAALLFADVNMTLQRKRLEQTLAVMVHALDDPDILLPALAALGRRHATYGVEHHHFDSVGDALLASLSDTLGDTFTAEVRTAWADAYALIASVMRRALIRAKSPSMGSTGEIAILEH